MTRANHISASRLVVPGMLTVVAGLLVSAPSSALAAQAHGYSFGFGGPGSGAGQLSLASNSGVAINDQTGDVYVADTRNNRVDEFTSKGEFVLVFGKEVNRTKVLGGVATEAEQNVCTELEVGLGAECQKGTSGTSPGELEAPVFVAVDNDLSSPSHGDVYVAGQGPGYAHESEDLVQKFSSEGKLEEGWGGKGQLNEFTGTGTGTTSTPAATGTGTIRDETTITNVVTSTGAFAVGQHISVPGSNYPGQHIPVGDTITAVGSGTITLSKKPTNSATETVDLSTEAETITNVSTSAGRFGVGESISGPGIPAGATIWGVEGNDLFLSENATAAASGVALSAVGSFGGIAGIAVDTSGALWVVTGSTTKAAAQNHVFEFGQEGTFAVGSSVNRGSIDSPLGIALDSFGSLYAVEGGAVVKLPPNERVFVGAIMGFAVAPSNNDLYVDGGSSIADVSSRCVPSTSGCSPVQVFGAPQLSGAAGLAVDTEGVVYAANSGVDQVAVLPVVLAVNPSPGSVSEVKATSATLNGEVNPKGSAVSECYFEYAASSEYGEGNLYSHTVPCEHPDAKEIGEGTSPVPVHAKIAGLRGGTLYHYRLVAKDASVTLPGNDETFTATGPVVTGAEAREVTGGGAELRASVNPEGVPVTRCAFEYGTSGEYGQLAKCEPAAAQIGAGSEPVIVTAKISGLSSDTVYHWRLEVKDANGEAYEPGHTFVYPTTGARLPDGRAYEMVTPPAKNGASVADCFACVSDHISADGSRVIASSIQCFAESPSCTGDRQSEGEPYEFTRAPAGWVTTPLAPPVSLSGANSAWLAGADEGVALFTMPTGPQGEDEWYARSPAGTFTPLGPATPSGITGIVPFETGAQAATADLSHFVWEGQGFGFWEFDKTLKGESSSSVYEYVGAHSSEPFLVGVTGGRGSTELVSTCSTTLGGGEKGSQWGVLSANGRTVYFTAQGNSGHEGAHCFGSGATNEHVEVQVNELYARVDGELADAHTVKISERSPSECTGACAGSPAGDAVFEGASVDGSQAFFTSTQQLTDRASEDSRSRNLYEYDFASPAGHSLIDVSAGDTSGLGPRVQGVVAISADGSHVYFVAQGVLTGAPNAQGQNAQPGRDNLYVYERDATHPKGHVAFVVKLPSSDDENWREGVGRANVTPDGRFLVFGSHGDLTPDDIRTDGANQIFRYDAQSEALIRVSIGDRGYNDNGNAGAGAATTVRAAATVETSAGPPRGDPTMSSDGSFVFFQSPIALTPHALNDVVAGHIITEPNPVTEPGRTSVKTVYAQNVYEYHEGRVYLISDGRDTNTANLKPCAAQPFSEGETDGSAVCLLGTDETGHNVFFMTADQLVPSDTNTQVDIYDARICEPANGNPCISEPPPPLPPCGGEQCHGIPAATPSLLAPGSASFNGEGNVTTVPPPPSMPKVAKKTVRCKRGYVDKKVRKKEQCVKAKGKKKGKKASRASNDRRAVR